MRRKSGAVGKTTGDGNVHLRSTDVFSAPTDLRNLWVCGLAFQLVWLASEAQLRLKAGMDENGLNLNRTCSLLFGTGLIVEFLGSDRYHLTIYGMG